MIDDASSSTPEYDESTTTSTTTTAPPLPPPTVCVIGGGPGAMFFCHSLETQKNLLLDEGEDISSFPTIVKCFERSSGPGGVWRSDRTHGDTNKEEVKKENESENGSLSSENIATATAITMDVDNHINIKIVLPSSSSSDEEEVELLSATVPPSLTSSSSSSSLTAIETVEAVEGVEAVEAVEGLVGVQVDADAHADDAKKDETSSSDRINMYSALWTNGHKEAFEFYDYTFVDHFGYDIASKLPTFLPRSIVLEYLIARVTHKCPDFFKKYFSFHTSVINVKYLEHKHDEHDLSTDEEDTSTSTNNDKNKFQVTIRNELTGLISMEYYDKCIWAGGNEGHPYIPETTKQLFTKHSNNEDDNNSNRTTAAAGPPTAPAVIVASPATTTTVVELRDLKKQKVDQTVLFPDALSITSVSEDDGNNNKTNSHEKTATNSSSTSSPLRIVHSSDTSNFKDDVYQKNVLIIGGSLSAEDLTLMAIKEGVNRVYITCRGVKDDENAVVIDASRWPYDKVTIHQETCVTNVSVCNEITLTKVVYCPIKRKYVLFDEKDYEEVNEAPIVLNNIDTVIFCTGYEPNFNMLDDNLHPYSKNKESRNAKFNAPKNWTMHPSTTTTSDDNDYDDDDADKKMNEGKDEHDNDNDKEDDDASSSSESSSSSSSSSSSDDDDEEDYDIEEYLQSLHHKLSRLYFGKNYKQIENNIIPATSSSSSEDNGIGGGIFAYGPYGAAHPHTLYRGIFSIPNPNMMYIVNQETSGPLMETDVTSWIIAKVITTSSSSSSKKQQHALPKTKQDMINENLAVNLELMKSPVSRYEMDPSYVHAIKKTYDPETDKHPKEEQIEKAYTKVADEEYYYALFLLGQYMIEYNYPISFIKVCNTEGSSNDNSETKTMTTTTTGKKTSYCWSNYYKTMVWKGFNESELARAHVDKYHNHGSDDENEKNKNNNEVPFWRTFRDHPNTDNFVSHFTGVKSVPLGPKKWFDLNENDKLW